MIDVPVLVKEALREGNTRKNYRFDVYNADETEVDFSIENDNLVKESVCIDERMCSDTNLKFGLCEGTQLEFQCFGVANITGRRLKAYVEVNYINENGVDSWHPVTLGWFTVKECSRQASTGILKVSCYNKLLSDYLDAKANALIEETFGDLDNIRITDIIDALLSDYGVNRKITSVEGISIDGEATNFEYTALRYNVLIGNHGMFSAGDLRYNVKAFGGNFTTSSATMTRGNIRIKRYSFDEHVYPTWVRYVDNMDALDVLINGTVIQSINENFKTPTTFISYLASYDWYESTSLITENVKGWFFHIQVEYLDGTVERYGKTLFELGLARGTFKDLNLITLTNVKYVKIIMPNTLYVSATISGGYTGQVGFSLNSLFYRDTYYESEDDFTSDWVNNLKTVSHSMFTFENGDRITPQTMLDHFSVVKVTNMQEADLIGISTTDIADVTLRDVQSAVFETQCQYGKLDRETDLFNGVELNNNRLLPADTLYPADDLYPNSMSERANRAMYSKLWADEGNVRSFRYLIITYKGTEVDPDTQQVSEVEKKLQRTVNTHGTDDYNMSDNWLFKNLVWADEDVGDYADAMVEKMRNITWFPFEMWCAGLPYIETGDEVEISVGQNTYTSYVLRRNLKGIQNLQDEMINGTLDIF